MLNRELLAHRVRDGILRPAYIAVEDAKLSSLAEQLIFAVEAGVEEPLCELESSLTRLSSAANKPKVARGLSKLLLDRVETHEPDETLASERTQAFLSAAALRRSLAPSATFADYETALEKTLSRPLEPLRETLYDDLPAQRKVKTFKRIAPLQLLQRYNLALAQGPLFEAERLTLSTPVTEVVPMRRVLRHLKFCRLVADVRPLDEGFQVDIEGPGAILSMQRKYGLQLASFLSAVPLLPHFQVSAVIRTRRGPLTMVLSEKDGLVSPFRSGSGYVPPEVRALADAFESEEWELELAALPRHVGLTGTCVPDFAFKSKGDGRTVALELFHPWHHRALEKRLLELEERPDASLLLGVDRALLKDQALLKARLEARPRAFLFTGFPSAKKVLELLQDLEGPLAR